jgi:hypothetical protein
LIDKISQAVHPSVPIDRSFDEISKNPGVTLLSLDPSETQIQLFHHPSIIGGSWTNPETKLVAVLGFDDDAKPIQLVSKSIKDFKLKSHSADDFAESMAAPELFKNLKSAQHEIHSKNIIAIPHLLTKVFLTLDSLDPVSVAMAFFQVMYEYDSSLDTASTNQANPENNDNDAPILDDESSSDQIQHDSESPENTNDDKTRILRFLHHSINVIQCCHLCYKGKISIL